MTSREVKVCEFFLRGQKAWHEDKVKSMFSSVDADAILAVQNPQSNISNKVAWVYSTNGLYSVNSGYYF